ncbi:MAG: hypothetical protein C0615_00575 [Desulfuromonas sp.]|nr:MAG: hypothetical protein C0615_00575 [Desulfuromonas sp.]
MKLITSRMLLLALLVTTLVAVAPDRASAASAMEIDIKVDATLDMFREKVPGGSRFLNNAKGVLTFPSVFKAGFVIGGEYGEGALRIGGKTIDYYSTAAASLGFQLGAQSKSIVLVFLSQKALTDFRNSKGWKVGADGSVAFVEWGAGKDINSVNIQDPIVAFAFNNKGLMYNLTLEGAKFTKLKK